MLEPHAPVVCSNNGQFAVVDHVEGTRHKRHCMKLNRIAIACTLTVVGIAGCASDPSKKVNAAEAELTSEEQNMEKDF